MALIKKSRKQILKKETSAENEEEFESGQAEITNLAEGQQLSAKPVKKTRKLKKLEFKDSLEAAKFAVKIAEDRKAGYVNILNVGPRLAITDYFVIIGAGNTRLTKRIAEDIQANLKKYNIFAIHMEGASEGNWILLDFDEFVVHIFTDEYRQYYDLERLWRDSKVIRIKASDKDIDENTGVIAKQPSGDNPDETPVFSGDGIKMEVEDI